MANLVIGSPPDLEFPPLSWRSRTRKSILNASAPALGGNLVTESRGIGYPFGLDSFPLFGKLEITVDGSLTVVGVFFIAVLAKDVGDVLRALGGVCVAFGEVVSLVRAVARLAGEATSLTGEVVRLAVGVVRLVSELVSFAGGVSGVADASPPDSSDRFGML